MIASFRDVYHNQLNQAVVELYNIRLIKKSEIIYTQTQNGTNSEKRYFWILSWKAKYWLNQTIKDKGFRHLMFIVPSDVRDGMRYNVEPLQDDLQSLAEAEFLKFIEQMQ